MTAASSSWLRLPIMDDSPHPYIILDSGAYSVWRSGAEVNLPRYVEYCKTVKDHVLTAVNLDVIPGAWGKRPTYDQLYAACEESYERYCTIKNHSGALTMPVYHQGDPIEFLDQLLDIGAEYIGISPTDSFSANVRQKWLHDIHDWMVVRGVKLGVETFTHGLGVFAPRILEGIPLWSADASTLLRYVAMKRIIVPKFHSTGKIKSWDAINVSERASRAAENVDWGYVYSYLNECGYEDGVHYHWHNERVVIEEPQHLVSVNLKLARRAMHESGVRCFVAGQHPLAIYQVTVVEKYPYILRSYAVIKETHGDTIKKLFNRTAPQPNRRPEKDHKVVVARGLFAQ